MLDKFIPLLTKDLELEENDLASGVPHAYSLPIDENATVMITPTSTGGFMLKCTVAQVPRQQEEQFLTRVMLGNLFGQGTRDAVLGLTPDGSKLTLSQNIEHPIEYKEFKEIVEEFCNSVDVWREETLSFSAAPPPRRF
jgi:hypothetical protein